MTETRAYRKITYQQRMQIARETWMVAFKLIEGQWWCNIMVLEGKTERIVNRILNKQA
jgi:hypothetical protein